MILFISYYLDHGKLLSILFMSNIIHIETIAKKQLNWLWRVINEIQLLQWTEINNKIIHKNIKLNYKWIETSTSLFYYLNINLFLLNTSNRFKVSCDYRFLTPNSCVQSCITLHKYNKEYIIWLSIIVLIIIMYSHIYQFNSILLDI